MDLVGLTNLASDVGALGVSILVIWALLTERLVPRGRLEDKQRELDECHRAMELERARHDNR